MKIAVTTRLRIPLLLGGVCGLLAWLPAHAATKAEHQTWTAPEAARREDPDFAVQGEYRSADAGPPMGAQVVALGSGSFDVYLLDGGLPGAGWEPGQPRTRWRGERRGGVVECTDAAGGIAATITPGALTLSTPGGAPRTLARVERQSATLGSKPPAGAAVLFDGTTVDQWEKGRMEPGHLLAPGCSSKQHFGDYTLHLEFRTPYRPTARGQQRGNSGVYHSGRWETQILDSFGLDGKDNECGGVYSIARPRLNMCLPPLAWQTYDVEFTAARFDAAGRRTAWPRLTVRLNGVLVHERLELAKEFTTSAPITKPLEGPTGPVYLQYHDNPVVFRNVWVVPGAPRPPNLLLVLADDLGYGDVGCYNAAAKVATPNIDRLAREGLRCTDAHSPSTVCTPSRYSLLTGRMAFRINYRNVFEGVGGPCLITADQLTLPQLLRQQGYATALTGKWHVGLSFLDHAGQRITQGGLEGVKQIDYARAIPDAPIHRGFDRFFGTACCPATDYLYAFIEGDRIPVPPTRMIDKSRLPKHPYAFDNRAGLIAPDFDLEEVDQVFLRKSREFLEQHAREQPGKPFFLLHSTHAVHLPSFASARFRGRTAAGPHGDFIHELDAIVGELLQTLERLGLAENTIVMFTSDNGPETTSVMRMRADYGHDGARPWRGLKRDQWEGGHRVPFLVRWPGKIAPGRTTDETVCLTDVMATLAAITGTALPGDAAEDSCNLLPVLLGQKIEGPVRPYTLHQTNSLALAIRRGPWKYLDHRGSGGNNYARGDLKTLARPDSAPEAPGQLYHLATDPGETTNLYFQHPEIVRELKALLESSKAAGRTRVSAP